LYNWQALTMIFVVLNSIFNSEADNPANGMFWQHFGLLGAVVTPPFAEHHSDISDLHAARLVWLHPYQVFLGRPFGRFNARLTEKRVE
jgi:hypothetical protein